MSCLFNSMNYFIKEGSNEIRQRICDYLRDNKPLIDGLETNKILEFEGKNYIETMRSQSTWGGGIEIQAACNIWNLKIIVINYRNRGNKNIEFMPLHNNVEKTIEVSWTGGHYEPIR